MKFWTTTMTAMALMLSMTPVVSQESASEQTYHMKMDDPAGLVESGYCLEILGRPGDEYTLTDASPRMPCTSTKRA